MLSGREDYGFHDRPVDRYGNALRRGSTGYKTEFSKYKIDEILKFVALNRKLCPKLKPWLEITNYYRGSYEPALKVALEACFDNIHAVEMVAKRERVAKRGASALEKKAARDAAVTLQFCRWLRAQAKVLKVALPKPPKLPPKPTRQSLKEKGTL